MSLLASIEEKPIRREAVSSIVVDRLMGFVKAGELSAGDRLPSERDLASSFGVSRPTIREALKVLAALGVVEIRHGGGVFVSTLSASDLLRPLTFFLSLEDVTVEKLYAARRLIEAEIAALAARSATEADISVLRKLLSVQTETVDQAERYREVDTDFHAKLADIADNPFLGRAAQSLNILGLEFRKIASETPAVLAGSIKDHGKIVAAIEERDPEACRKAMADHMDFVLKTTRLAMEGRHG
ncbi:FadR/GntR family transcriptional regulator [Chelativorans sp. AA-79]|uniref:FadR/GntR family transcriptional regulator n=1 Tax=Chelativorans sp. AA-79 TaxID=3028735 RepID=UPI0023F8853A|nr:FadR/GntR family transcriptional regulator [Chelativorans sp. AA-79]WEX12056.1 FadR/GntR family transcriptional regulator [Chelativorans sp. AA-79]